MEKQPTPKVDADATVGTNPDAVTFLSLPPEIRLEIYGYLVKDSGVINVWAQRSNGLHTDRTTIALLHTSHLIRIEVEEFFYRTQTFSFRSIPAIAAFIKRSDAGIVNRVRFIDLGAWLCTNFGEDLIPSLGQCLDQLPALEQIHIQQYRIFKYAPRTLVRWEGSIRQYKTNICTDLPKSALKVVAALTALPRVQHIDLYWSRCLDERLGIICCSKLYLVPKGENPSHLKGVASQTAPQLVQAKNLEDQLLEVARQTANKTGQVPPPRKRKRDPRLRQLT